MFTTIKYLQSLFSFHKAREIYRPPHSEEGEDMHQVGWAGGRGGVGGRGDVGNDRADLHMSLFPFSHPLKGLRFISI